MWCGIRENQVICVVSISDSIRTKFNFEVRFMSPPSVHQNPATDNPFVAINPTPPKLLPRNQAKWS